MDLDQTKEIHEKLYLSFDERKIYSPDNLNLPAVSDGRWHPNYWKPLNSPNCPIKVYRNPKSAAYSACFDYRVSGAFRHYEHYEFYRRQGWRLRCLEMAVYGSAGLKDFTQQTRYSPWVYREGDSKEFAPPAVRKARCCVPPMWSTPSPKWQPCNFVLFCPYCWARSRVGDTYDRLTWLTKQHYRDGVKAIGVGLPTAGADSYADLLNRVIPGVRKDLQQEKYGGKYKAAKYVQWILPKLPGREEFEGQRNWSVMTKVLYVFRENYRRSLPSKERSFVTIHWPADTTPTSGWVKAARQLGRFFDYPADLWFLPPPGWILMEKEKEDLGRRRLRLSDSLGEFRGLSEGY